jgi:phytoene dehydrogenase-like protein
MSGASRSHYDVVIVGGGHNGLTAAAYLAGAGLHTLVLERLPHVGGAAISTEAFPGTGVRLSRYSYLVSLLPDQIVKDLDLDLELRSRGTASYSPTRQGDRNLGLLVERNPSRMTKDSFRELTGSDDEFDKWRQFYSEMNGVAEVIAPTLTNPLPREQAIREQIGTSIWNSLTHAPLGALIEERFSNDLVRGVVATDGLIGTFADLNDPSLIQNRCFLYHLIGNGTGEWKVPVGGMGSVTGALERSAAASGAEILTNAGVSSIRTGDGAEVEWHDGNQYHRVSTRWVLSNVAPWVLRILMGEHVEDDTKPVGSQIKINFLLSRLPSLKSGISPDTAFAGTFHLNEGYDALARAYQEAASDTLPTDPPGEFYCHSLTDPSIMGPMGEAGAHALTYFGLHLPANLFELDSRGTSDELVRRTLASLDSHLVEPLLDCVLRDANGDPCIEVKTPQDVEADLAMPGGHIFHGDLSWPWAQPREALDTPAQVWGVATDNPSVLLCGSGARRGGAVSGIGGHNAAKAILAT